MNNLQMIQVDQLRHHPENPRLDLGDLTELADSIRQNGIMQNLTVVPSETEKDAYLVVIGNRRMEAAKIAGLAEVPCVVSFMNHKEQIATMLMENMQRTDLTVYEQAQGFQMMMDIGFTEKEISKETGFSETTVRRRLKMAELDKGELQKAVGKQITIEDLDRLSQLKSVKQRNALLKEYGDSNYNWKVTRAIDIQKSHEMKPKAMEKIREAKIKKLPEKEKYSGKYRQLYGNALKLYDWDGKKNFIPKTEGQLFYVEDDTSINFYVKEKKQKSAAPEKTEEEKAEERKRELAWKTVDRCAETAAELREQFVKKMPVSPKNAMQMMQWALVAAFASMLSWNTPTMTIRTALDIKGTTDEVVASAYHKINALPQSKWPGLMLMMFEGDWKGNNNKPPRFANGSRREFPKWSHNTALELGYEWLTEFGYEMSTEEIEMMAGTHEVFQEGMT